MIRISCGKVISFFDPLKVEYIACCDSCQITIQINSQLHKLDYGKPCKTTDMLFERVVNEIKDTKSYNSNITRRKF